MCAWQECSNCVNALKIIPSMLEDSSVQGQRRSAWSPMHCQLGAKGACDALPTGTGAKPFASSKFSLGDSELPTILHAFLSILLISRNNRAGRGVIGPSSLRPSGLKHNSYWGSALWEVPSPLELWISSASKVALWIPCMH